MLAIRLEKPRHLECIELQSPTAPGPGQALVRTHRVGICGTDYSGYLGKHPLFRYPLIPGHELGVEVLEVGEDVSIIKVGDHCSVEPYMNCGSCYACRKGNSNCCEVLKVIGVMVDGGLCEEFVVRADKLHPSNRLSFEQLALVETLGIGCHATERGAPKEDDSVLIIGAGPIGLATLEFTRLSGASITVMDMVQSRLDFCQQTYDIKNTILFDGSGSEKSRMDEITNGELYELVTDVTGSHHSMGNALNYVAHTGRLVYVGITTEKICFPHPSLHRPEMTIKGSRNALPKDFRRIINLIEDGVIDTNPWITHRTPLENVIENFSKYTQAESGVIKAMIEVTK